MLNNLFKVTLIIISFLYAGNIVADNVENKETMNIVLIGASIGKGWDFPQLPERVGIEGYKLEYIGVFDTFDKSSAIDEVVKRTHKPNAVIIKECSVYFPGDIDVYKNLIIAWINKLHASGIEPILATSVPPGKPTNLTYKFKEFVKDLMGKPKKIEQLATYNDWLRQYAIDNGIKLFDLEKILRVSEENRYLKEEYDRGDHTHLNQPAYETLDINIKPFLLTVSK